MRICLDMDEVIVDNYAEYHRQYREMFGKDIDPTVYAGGKIYDQPGAAAIRNTLYEPGHFRNLPMMAGAYAGVKELYEHYDVYIVTASMEFKYSFTDKWEWLEEHMPFFDKQRLVFCGNKSIVHGDFMVDDKVRNLATFGGTGLLFTAAHNLNDEGYHRVNNWGEVIAYFRAERAGRSAC